MSNAGTSPGGDMAYDGPTGQPDGDGDGAEHPSWWKRPEWWKAAAAWAGVIATVASPFVTAILTNGGG